jgi:hypothetical protein
MAVAAMGACHVKDSGTTVIGGRFDTGATPGPITSTDAATDPGVNDAAGIDTARDGLASEQRLDAPADASGDARPPPDLLPAADAAPPDLTVDRAAPDAPPVVELRIAVNGPAHVGVDFPGRWAADPGEGGVCTGSSYHNDDPINGTVDDALFHREMYGSPVTCAVGGGKLPAGRYQVNLYFAEIYWGPGCPAEGPGTGTRLFDVRLENAVVLSGLDLFSEGGCAASDLGTGKPVVKRFTVMITDGTLNVRLEARRDNAKISAIEIISAF